jgi:hypothetical protein
VPAYLPYNTVSPTFKVTGLSLVPGPTATTVPLCGFSFAVSGIIIPEEVFVSAAAGSTRTRSAMGLMFRLLIMILILFTFFRNYAKAIFDSFFKTKMPACQ